MEFNMWALHWASWDDFFAMGGYAFYVWGSFLACALLLVWECLQAKSAWSLALKDLEQFYALERDRSPLKPHGAEAESKLGDRDGE